MRDQARWILVLLLVFAGCGGSSNKPPVPPGDRAQLEGVGEAYRLYCLRTNKPPTKYADLSQSSAVVDAGLVEVKMAKIIVQYGAMMVDLETEGASNIPSDEVVAYMADVPTLGGQVLMLNRSVKHMTADEFKAAKKAGAK